MQIVVNMCVLSYSVVSDSFVTPCTVPRQTPLSMEFSRQEYWNGLSFPTPRDLPNPGIKPKCPVSPALADEFFTTVSPGKLSTMFLQKSYYKLNEFILSAT